MNDLAAKNYILGTAHAVESTRQDVYSGSITGEPFSDWAGPVSLALNAEYRREKATVDSDPIAQVSGWSSGNLQPLGAQYHVKEAAVETLIPLLSKLPFADSWDLNAAFRATDYEVSGYVTTWKIGTTYSPIPDIKLRGTVSRDIRAPNISELFQAQNYGLISDYDPVTGQNTTHGRTQLGNPNLKPEVATNYTAGVVLQPSFMEGFNMSVDYWSVDIKDAISLIGASDVIVQCYNGRPDLCPWITRDPVTNVITTVQQGYFNLASEKAAGVDYEATYLLPLASLISSFPGHATFHVTGTRNIKNITNDGLTLPTDAAGSLSLPKTILNGSLTYEPGPVLLQPRPALLQQHVAQQQLHRVHRRLSGLHHPEENLRRAHPRQRHLPGRLDLLPVERSVRRQRRGPAVPQREKPHQQGSGPHSGDRHLRPRLHLLPLTRRSLGPVGTPVPPRRRI